MSLFPTSSHRAARPQGARVAALLVPLVAGAALLGCSSASSSVASTVPPTTPGISTTGSVPDVANATDLKTAPVPGAGTTPPPTQLVLHDLVVGTGTPAAATNVVSVQYVGANFADGKTFDSSWAKGGAPVDFPLSGVIAGFAQGIVGMKIGGRRELVIPPALGYGAQGFPPAVGPNETLVFVIDLVGVK